MKTLILPLLLIVYVASQPGAMKIDMASTIAPSAVAAMIKDFRDSPAPSTSSTPSADMAMDSSASDSANIPTSMMDKSTPATMVRSYTYTSPFDNANNAWNYLQNLGGGCCGNCNKICGFAIKLAGTNNYLTNMGTWYQFKPTSNPGSSQIFTIGQNSDCTWYFSNSGSYLSLSSIYSGNWVGPSSTIGSNARWYIERSGSFVYVQSAFSQYYYWRASSFPNFFLGYSFAFASRLTMEYFPCDKTFGWNW